MFENLRNEVKDGFKPLLNVVDIQFDTAQKIAREQLDFMGECLDVGARQAQTLRDDRSAKTLFEVPVTAGREFSARCVRTAGRQWRILLEARDALTGEGRSAATDMGTNAQQAVEPEAAVQQAKPEAAKASSFDTETRKTDTAVGKAS